MASTKDSKRNDRKHTTRPPTGRHAEAVAALKLRDNSGTLTQPDQDTDRKPKRAKPVGK